MITDTQVLSYYFKGSLPLPDGIVQISSITAAEFLLVQSQIHEKPNYYPILPTRLRLHKKADPTKILVQMNFDSRRHAAAGKRRTDQLVLSFGPEIPAYIEYGSLALSQLINSRYEDLYMSGITHLSKEMQKKLQNRFRFLLSIPIKCVPITQAIAGIGMNLLAQFMERHQAKENMRNTINDVLILATAIKEASSLLTKDNLLQRFAAEIIGASCKKEAEYLFIDFSVPETQSNRKPLESKGYINRGWQILERRGR